MIVMNICFIRLRVVGGAGQPVSYVSLTLTMATEHCYEHVLHHSDRCGGCGAASVISQPDVHHGD
jgi:hypothetical protein